MVYIDAHCHLGSRQFDDDRDEMIFRMKEAEVRKAIIICCSDHDLEAGISLRKENPGFKLACGIHPQDLERDNGEERLERFRNTVLACHPDMIGEIGLDFYSHRHTGEAQRRFFIYQLELARQTDLPADIHSRRASGETLRILKEHPVRGILHSFSGSAEMAAIYVKLGYYISFGSSVLFQGAKRPAEVIASVPLERLLIETDAPYQSPVRDRRHEPADVIRIYREISRIRKISIEELEEAVEANFDRVFAE